MTNNVNDQLIAGSTIASADGAVIRVEVIELTQAGVGLLTNNLVQGLVASPAPQPDTSVDQSCTIGSY